MVSGFGVIDQGDVVLFKVFGVVVLKRRGEGVTGGGVCGGTVGFVTTLKRHIYR